MKTMKPIVGELVTFLNSRGLQLNGIFYRQEGQRTTIIHVHGSLGNFYANVFIPLMARMYSDKGINFFSINTSCHDGIAEGERKGMIEYVGGSRTEFSECLYDIEGAVAFAKAFSDRVILQGHSLGCDRVLYYLLNGTTKCDLVLLAPCDSYELQARWIAPETVHEQIQRLKMQSPFDPEFDWLPLREYGVKGGEGWTYPIPITRKAFLSIAEGPPYCLIKIKEPAKFHINQKALIYIGGKDPLQVWSHDVMFKYLRERISDVQEVYVPRGDHMLAGCEEEVIERIIQWASATEK
jgi:pimeloyl-ACP methyl ester carboxylesterase